MELLVDPGQERHRRIGEAIADGLRLRPVFVVVAHTLLVKPICPLVPRLFSGCERQKLRLEEQVRV